jgi:hypothetical protein
MQALSLGYKEVIPGDDYTDISGLTLCAIFNLMDQPKPTTREFKIFLRQTGVKFVIGTNVHFTGALAVARMFGYGTDICNEEMSMRDDIPKKEAAKTAKTISIPGGDFEKWTHTDSFPVMVKRDAIIMYRCNA